MDVDKVIDRLVNDNDNGQDMFYFSDDERKFIIAALKAAEAYYVLENSNDEVGSAMFKVKAQGSIDAMNDYAKVRNKEVEDGR